MATLDEDSLSEYFSRLGRKGAEVRNKRLSPEERKRIASKASQAATKARQKKNTKDCKPR